MPKSKNPDLITNEEYVTCQVCGRQFTWIQNSHLSSHLLTLDKYKQLYPGAPTKTRKIYDNIVNTRARAGVSKELPICAREGCDNRVKKAGNKYCSYSCNGKVRAHDKNFAPFIQDKNPDYIKENLGLSKYTRQRYNKKAVFERDEHKCVRCEKKLEDDVLKYSVHHLVPRRLITNKDIADQLSNLVTLCNSCHGIVEREFIQHIFGLYGKHDYKSLEELMIYLRANIKGGNNNA